MPSITSTDLHAWWLDLRHHGLVIAPALLDEYFPRGPVEPDPFRYQRLREHYAAFDLWYQQPDAFEQGSNHKPLYTWLDHVLDEFMGLEEARWQRGNRVDEQWKHRSLLQNMRLSPQRVLFYDDSRTRPALFVMVEPVRQLMYGRGRTAYGRLLELLRAKQVKLGLLTNGRQFRLCYAGIDHDSWVEWDVDAWFAEGELRRRLYGFYTLLGPAGMNSPGTAATSFPLLEAAEASRTRQGELSTVLGEQVRQSVETLLNEVNQASRHYDTLDDQGRSVNTLFERVYMSPNGTRLSQRHMLAALYQAAVRIIMRLVIIFFAEARDMLPRSLATYAASYSLDGPEGLFEQLRRAEQYEGLSILEERHSAWARLLSLFTLIYRGSTSPALPSRAYGGLLFGPGDFDSPDPVLRAVALFELPSIAGEISDATVLHLLKLLKIGRVRVKGRRKPLNGPVDFSELRTEYIGLMYQGLLDFSLHTADEPMIFLNLGQEPILPLKTLEGMADKHLKELLKKLRVEKGESHLAMEDEGEEVGEEDALEEAQGEESAEAPADEIEEEEATDEEDEALLTEEDLRRQRALQWAERAVEVAGLVRRPKGAKKGQQDRDYRFERERSRAAGRLVKRVLDRHDFYLIRRGGTRKGSGTFYTRPQLAVPMARRTLEPLLYMRRQDGTLIPRKPGEILDIKVCDPACGSASFLVAALHYITDALYQSLVYHEHLLWLPEIKHTYFAFRPKTLPLGRPSQALPGEYLIPVHPNDPRLEALTKARLRRHVVESCLYGVDLSPLAVELARMSLWIETMDRELPFTFLDHKIKRGNALIGGWLDTFREYPAMAWKREGGDTGHSNGVHYTSGAWTRALKEKCDEVIKPELADQICASLAQLFPVYIQQTPRLFGDFLAELQAIHELPIEDVEEREERYRALQEREEYRALKAAFHRWCAAWFWPADQLADIPTPASFYQPGERTQQMVQELADELGFFHWELEFLDVFNRPAHGFDAILANPPWEITKPYSKEFFSDYDPLYRTYGKQEALQEQRHLFQLDQDIEREWLLYQSYFKGLSNWAKYAASPFGDPASKVRGRDAFRLKRGSADAALHALWRKRRAHYEHMADTAEPFRFQGSADLNTYKMFLEVAHHLLKPQGRLGMLVPSGVYTDEGSATLRRLFLDRCRWFWLFGFINHDRIFDIDSRFKFVVLLLEKGEQTDTMRVTFNRPQLADLEQPDQFMLDFPRSRISRFSPKSLAIVEAQTQRDFSILEKLYRNSVLLGDQDVHGWQLRYTTEFHMTNDSKLFPPLPDWEARGYRRDGYGRWVDGDGDVALPLYEGRMVGAFDPSAKGWVEGKGRKAIWRDIPFEHKVFEPQYLLSLNAYKSQEEVLRGNKIGFMDIGSATNTRSMYATFIGDMPCGNKVPTLLPEPKDIVSIQSLLACLNSFTYDYALRCRLGGITLNYFIIAETPLIPPARIHSTICAQIVARLNLIMPCFAPQWLDLRSTYPQLGDQHWRKLWAITRHERLRLRCILDAIIAELYGLEYDDFAWILRDDPTNLKGFWRVDKKEAQELRHTTLALAAFRRLKEVGLAAFAQEDWQFPAEIAAHLGPRFTPWQEQKTVAESWEECELHMQRMNETPVPLLAVERVTTTDYGKDGSKKSQSKIMERAPIEQVDLWSNLDADQS